MDRRFFTAAAICICLRPSSMSAAMSKPYHADLVISGFDARTGRYEGGIDIRLDPGWKTYWRMPGDAGIPPQFDWSGSRNVKSVSVSWPAPRRFMDASGETVGYEGRVVFPLNITTEDPSAPVDVKLAMFFGVCKDICIPGNEHLDALSAQTNPAAAALIESFAVTVPREVDDASPFRVVSAKLDAAKGKYVLRLGLDGRWQRPLDIFVESDSSAYFHEARPAQGESIYLIEVTGGDPEKLRGREVILTMIAGNTRLEQKVTVE
jgi:DsbC/DsbD-like thiol-disulfide interchange protein